MNEQLINQIAQRIDAQTAQSVQSHDVQVKGKYLWEKYPQVHTCPTYNEAVLLLAREQAVLQQPPSSVQSFGATAANTMGSGFVNQQMQVPAAFNAQASQQSGGMTAFQQPPQGYVNQMAGVPGYSNPMGYGAQEPNGFGSPPPIDVFGTLAVPQTGNVAGANFTAFKPSKDNNAASGKVFGIIPSNVFAIIIIGIVSLIVVCGIIVSIVNAVSPSPADAAGNQTTAEQAQEDDIFAEDPYGGLFD